MLPTREAARPLPSAARRIVIKVGSAVLVGDGPSVVDRPVFTQLVAAVAQLQREGRECLLVTSGAVALGRRLVQTPARPGESLSRKQALAALGQPALMELYARELSFHGLHAAQILMTREDLDDRRRYLSFRETLRALARIGGCVPVLNENDTLSSEEIRFGDNDRLAALVAGAWDADLLIILSDVSGLCDADPRTHAAARRLSEVDAEDPALEALCPLPQGGGVGTGGMLSKVQAARIAGQQGVHTVIAPGRQSAVIEQVLAGEDIGTLFRGARGRRSKRKDWLRFASIPVGTLTVDVGALRALASEGRSLLSAGVVEVTGDFLPGATVAIAGPDGHVVAHGLALYGADDCRRILGRHSDTIHELLGYSAGPNVIHRDDLVFLAEREDPPA